MKGKKDILRRVCEGGNVVTREIDEVSDGGNTMQDERGRDGVSIRQNQNITEDMLEGFTLVCPGENHDENRRQKPKIKHSKLKAKGMNHRTMDRTKWSAMNVGPVSKESK